MAPFLYMLYMFVFKITPSDKQSVLERYTIEPVSKNSGGHSSTMSQINDTILTKLPTAEQIATSPFSTMTQDNDTIINPFLTKLPPDPKTPTAPFSTTAHGNATITNPFLTKLPPDQTPTAPFSITTHGNDTIINPFLTKLPPDQTPTAPFATTAQNNDTVLDPHLPKSTDEITPTEPYVVTHMDSQKVTIKNATENVTTTDKVPTTMTEVPTEGPTRATPLSGLKRFSFTSSGFQVRLSIVFLY